MLKRTKSLRKDEDEIRVLITRNKDVASEEQARLRSIASENEEILKLAQSQHCGSKEARKRIKRSNKVLPRFVHAVRNAEVIEEELEKHLRNTLSAHEV